MAFTDNSDLYGAINEEGINRVVKHMMRLRPSMFNYGTELVEQNPELLCHPIEADPVVFARNNPLITVESPLPVLGTNGLVSLHYCVQLVDVGIDFHPNNALDLPKELTPMAEQRFALGAKACVGLGCPDEDLVAYLERIMGTLNPPIDVEQFIPGAANDERVASTANVSRFRPKPFTIPVRRLLCFCMEVYAVGHIETTKIGNKYVLAPKLDNIEIVDLCPEGLENSVECYLELVLKLGLLPRVRVALEKIVLDQLKIVNIEIKPTPGLPNNPAIENDELKVFIDMEVV